MYIRWTMMPYYDFSIVQTNFLPLCRWNFIWGSCLALFKFLRSPHKIICTSICIFVCILLVFIFSILYVHLKLSLRPLSGILAWTGSHKCLRSPHKIFVISICICMCIFLNFYFVCICSWNLQYLLTRLFVFVHIFFVFAAEIEFEAPVWHFSPDRIFQFHQKIFHLTNIFSPSFHPAHERS